MRSRPSSRCSSPRGRSAAALYAKGYVDRYLDRKPAAHISLHYFAFTLLSLSMTAVVTASGGYTFLFWWELMTLSSFVLILFDAERKEVLKAALTYLVMMHLASSPCSSASWSCKPPRDRPISARWRATSPHTARCRCCSSSSRASA